MDPDNLHATPENSSHAKDYQHLTIARLIIKLVADPNIENFEISSNDNNTFGEIIVKTKSAKNDEKYAIQIKSEEFSIRKYFDSFKTITVDDSHKIILITNAKLDINNNGTIGVQDCTIAVSECELPPLFETFENCFKFSVLSSLKEEDKTFFDRLLLCTDQANEERLKVSVARDFQNKFCCTENEASRFLEFISEQGGTKLDQELMKYVIAILLLSPYMKPLAFGSVSDRAMILKTAIDLFDVTICEEETCNNLRGLWGCSKIELKTKTKEAYELITKYRLNIEKKDIEDMTDEECTILLWFMKKCPLIVDGNATTLKAIQLCGTNKYVLLGRKLPIKKQLKNISLLQNLSDVKIHPEIFKNIVSAFKISVQEKKELSLKTLIGDCSKIDITVNELLQMVDRTVIGDVKETLPTPYIPRFLSKTIITHRYLKNMSSDTIVVISCMKKGDHIKKLRRRFNTVNINEDPSNRRLNASIYLAEDEYSKEEFESFCQKKRVQKIHHFTLTNDGNLEWLRSKSDITDLLQHCKRETQFIEEREFYYSKVESNVTIVVGEAGMGKSVLMKSLKNNCAPNLWTVLLCPKDISMLCQYLQGKKCDKIRFENFVLQKKCGKDFDRKLLKMLFEKNQVVYLWDGLDEVSSEEMKTVTDLISKISKEDTRHWITSRDYLKSYLENKFNVFARFLKGFSAKELMFYVRKRLKDNFSEEKIQHLMSLLGDGIFENTLNIYMLTELLQDSEMYLHFLNNDFNVADIFRCFIDKRIAYKAKEDSEKRIYFEKFQKAAVRALLPEIRINCDEFLTEIRENGDPFGMMRVDKDGVHFLHTAFAEYFVATYLVDNYATIRDLENVLFKIEHVNIRYLFDLLLAKDSKAHMAVLYKNLELLKECKDLKSCKDLGGRNPLHLACSWGLIYPRLPLKCRQKNYFVIDDKSIDFVLPESEEYAEMLQYLLNVCDPLETDQVYGLNSVAYAEKSDCLFAKTLFLLNQKKQFLKLTDDVSLVSVVFYSALYGYNQVIDLYKELPLIQVGSSGDTLLHLSVMHLEYLEKILQHDLYRKNIDKRNKDGETPLYYACLMGFEDSVQLLIDNGADIDAAGDFRRMPLLHMVCLEGNASIVKLLVKSGANIMTRDLRGLTPLHMACYSGNFEIVDFLMKNGCNKNITDYVGYTPLHLACQNGHKKVANLLIKTGAKINATEEENCTPLHLACQNGHKGVVKLLLSGGANVHLAHNEGWTPFFYACFKENVEVIRLLLEFEPSLINKKCNGLTPFHTACARGLYRVATLLMQYHVGVNGSGRDGMTPLHFACIGNHPEIVQLLVKKGANVNCTDQHGNTPLHYASANGNANIVRILLASTASVRITNNTQWTPLHIACEHNHLNVVQILLEAGASIEATTQEDWTPLHVACQNGSTEVAKFLIQKNASVATIDDRGRIPLHLASRFGHVEIVKTLIEAGSTIDLRERLVRATPLHFAVFRNHTEVCRLLLEAGADPNAADTSGVTVVKLAFDVDAVDIMKLLVEHGGRTNGLDLSMMGRMAHHIRFQLELR